MAKTKEELKELNEDELEKVAGGKPRVVWNQAAHANGTQQKGQATNKPKITMPKPGDPTRST